MPTDTVYGLVAVAAEMAPCGVSTRSRAALRISGCHSSSVDRAGGLVADMTESARRLAVRSAGRADHRRAEEGWLSHAGVGGRGHIGCACRTIPPAGDRRAARAADGDEREPLGRARSPIRGRSASAIGRRGRRDRRWTHWLRHASSTVVDCADPGQVRVLREGAVERAAIAEALAGVSTLI